MIRLIKINLMFFFVFCFLPLWYGPCSFSKMCVAQKHTCFVFVDHIVIFPHFFLLKRCALNSCEYWSKFQPVNSDLIPFRPLLHDVGTKTTPAQVEVCITAIAYDFNVVKSHDIKNQIALIRNN